jgi:hypothetical protein
MKHLIATSSALGMALFVAVAPGYSQSVSLKKCLSIREDIEKYSELRRQGGSAMDMEEWKREKRKLEEQFRELDCKAYGDAVR